MYGVFGVHTNWVVGFLIIYMLLFLLIPEPIDNNTRLIFDQFVNDEAQVRRLRFGS